MTDPLPPITEVSGGVAGVEAERDAAYFLAQRYDATGDQARGWAALGSRTALDPDLVESAPLSPVSFAGAQAAVLRATVGPSGALGQCLVWEAEALRVRAAVDLVVAADELVRQAVEGRDYALGRLAGGFALGFAPITVPLVVHAAPVWLVLPPSARAAVLGAVQEEISDHPALVEAAFNGGGGLLDGLLAGPPLPGIGFALPVFHPDTGAAASEVASLYDDGSAAVRELDPAVLPGPPLTARSQPGTLAGLLGSLAGVAGLSVGASSPLNGTVAVSTLSDVQGRTRHIVYVPGTDDMTTLPWTQDGDVRDMGTNLALMAGSPTAYADGVLQAMAYAGVKPGEPVLLVGHSQGGMVAAALAAADTPYDVGHVVSAGSPTAQVDLPPGTRVLSLENAGDVVPLTDGEPNRPSVDQVTVRFDAGGEGLAGHHDHDRYVAGAAAADASCDPSVSAALDALRDEGFLGGGAGVGVETRVFQVTRR